MVAMIREHAGTALNMDCIYSIVWGAFLLTRALKSASLVSASYIRLDE